MSEHITHVGAFEDASRILLEVSDLDALFKESLETYYDTALCTSASRGNHLFAVPHLQEVKQRQRERGYVDESDRQLLASSLGWLMHRAVDHELDDAIVGQIEEIREEEGLSEEEINIDEHQIYEDAIVFREVYAGGRRTSRSPHQAFSPATLAADMEGHPGSSAVDVADAELILGALWQQRVLQLQAFTGQEDDPEAWMDAFVERRQVFSEDLPLFVEAFENPDPEKMRYYNERINTYDGADGLVRMARAIQVGEQLPALELEAALEAATDQSAYARALAQAYRNVRGAADYFDDDISKDELYEIIDVWEGNRY